MKIKTEHFKEILDTFRRKEGLCLSVNNFEIKVIDTNNNMKELSSFNLIGSYFSSCYFSICSDFTKLVIDEKSKYIDLDLTDNSLIVEGTELSIKYINN